MYTYITCEMIARDKKDVDKVNHFLSNHMMHWNERHKSDISRQYQNAKA